MSTLLNTSLGDIREDDILALVAELEAICPIAAAQFRGLPLRFFLTQCVYPNGAGTKRVPISTANVPLSPLLEMPVGKLPSGALYELCREISVCDGKAREFSHGQKLVTFLSRAIDKCAPNKPSSETKRRKDGIALTRRNNRRV